MSASIIELVQAEKHQIAIDIVEIIYAKLDPTYKSYSRIQKYRSIQDVGYHLTFLIEAIKLNSPSSFKEYYTWVRSVLISRGITEQTLFLTIQAIHDYFNKILSKEEIQKLEYYLQQATDAIEAPYYPYRSLLEENVTVYEINSPLYYQHEILRYLLNIQRDNANQCVKDALEHGFDLKWLYISIFQPILYEIGKLWEINKITVAQEHYCTSSIQWMMAQLYSKLFHHGKTGKNILATCIGEELHEMGIRMLADLFEMEGWDSYFLGANTPQQSIIHFILEHRVDIIAISVTMLDHSTTIQELISEIQKIPNLTSKIIVGGGLFNRNPNLWKSIGADGWAQNAIEAIDLAEKLIEK